MILGRKVALLPFDEAHVPLVRRWVNQPDVRAGTGTEGPVSDYEHRRWYERVMEDPTRRTFVIGDAGSPDAMPVGLIGLSNLNLRSRTGEYWIYVGEAGSRRRGLAMEATILILDYGFNTLGLHRIYLHVMENNLPAANLYRKLGFVQEGVARQHMFWQGRYLDMIQFAMLEDEFRRWHVHE
jgi:UDP-4-amino-4,6-dideoxy-N-acetyl-beta-L-altrosamine N-acetyltransferase